MPNWCHNTLTVDGPLEDVQAFAKRVATDEQPLTFAAHVPEPTPEGYAVMAAPCDLCGGTGQRPTTAEHAATTGARWDAYFDKIEWLSEKASAGLAFLDCNGCRSTGKKQDGWNDWRCDNWGTKWDASFDGPFMALGTAEANVAGSVASNGRVDVLNHLVYRFDTAWSPPTPWLERVVAEHPTLSFELRYGEPGNDFAGIATGNGGSYSEREAPVAEILDAEEMWF